MRIFGIDFTSRPTGRKPISVATCRIENRVLRVEAIEHLHDWDAFEGLLAHPGPWVAGIDFPFGQPRRLILDLGWPFQSWEGYVALISEMKKADFEQMLST